MTIVSDNGNAVNVTFGKLTAWAVGIVSMLVVGAIAWVGVAFVTLRDQSIENRMTLSRIVEDISDMKSQIKEIGRDTSHK